MMSSKILTIVSMSGAKASNKLRKYVSLMYMSISPTHSSCRRRIVASSKFNLSKSSWVRYCSGENTFM